jgi:hypothetical protein
MMSAAGPPVIVAPTIALTIGGCASWQTRGLWRHSRTLAQARTSRSLTTLAFVGISPFVLFPFAIAILVRNGWIRGMRTQYLTQRWFRWPLIAGTVAVAVLAGVMDEWLTLGLAASLAWAATFDPAQASRTRTTL